MHQPLLAILFLVPVVAAVAQSPEELTKVITGLDAALFESYNHCELDKFASFFTDDVEFYRDHNGLEVGKAKLIEGVKKNVCGKLTRELVPGTLIVHPVEGFGALETGVHQFRRHGQDDAEPAGEAKFIHLWRYLDGKWTLARVISYDHRLRGK